MVYNASAGSGKTYTLVKSYLEKLLTNPNPDTFRHLLAITFTNKAVTEMKSRILKVLVQLSRGEMQEPAKSIAKAFEEEHQLGLGELQERSQRILKHLLNNYALFSVETIDHFNHRLLRTFSRDLGLNPNFEVSMETPLLLAEAVDQLIALAGEDPEITKWLVQFALQKTEEDKSWDVSRDLRNSAKLLTQENDLVYLEKLRYKSLEAFEDLRNILYKRIHDFESIAQEKAQHLLSLFEQNALDATHFDRGSLYNFFEKIAEGATELNVEMAWQNKVGVAQLYPKRVENTPQADAIDKLVPIIAEILDWIRCEYPSYLKHQNITTQLIPLATVHLVDTQLQGLKSTYNLLPISEFNSIIHKEIKNQPAPFIYERLGERYQHFFIDEFQDTSLLQWDNLQPLVENALAQSQGEGEASLMIVGDAKQSIYRWRGGLPEQFIRLYSGENPFPFVEKKTINLDTNFRSCKEVVTFNNRFFTYLSGQFDDNSHQGLFADGNKQKYRHDFEGYVKLSFLESVDAEETNEVHPEAVKEQIKSLLERGYKPGDICVLTRKRQEGVIVSEALSKEKIQVVSEETLLLKNAPAVKVLIDLLQLSLRPEDDEAKVRILEFIAELAQTQNKLHDWAQACIGKGTKAFQNVVKEQGYPLNFWKLRSLGVFETLEYFIQRLGLNLNSDAFLVSFMDWVFQFSQNPLNGKTELLEYWELKKDELSIRVPNDGEAVRVMTIHKSKGLQFPVVLFPFAHLDIYKEIDPQLWYPWNEDGFEELLIRFKKEIATYSDAGALLYQKHRSTLQLDNLNLLYVALTRAQQELYIFSKMEFSKSEPKTYADFFQGYLQEKQLWNPTKTIYDFGKLEPPQFQEDYSGSTQSFGYIVALPEEHGLSLIQSINTEDMYQGATARAFGNIFHEFMGGIHHKDELEQAWGEISTQYSHNLEAIETLPATAKLLFENELLTPLFTSHETILIEKDIITPNGVVRPDRMNLHADNSITLLDYKTGEPRESHKIQMKGYTEAVQAMGYSIRNAYLVYVKPEEILVNKT